ncbi:MAG: phospho-sugar mutase [Oscillospiraceae bacterium]|jgi:phosphoglucomutase|nr:phospho-sugar mutase [Oscillospiraceae bacterium]
MNEKKLLDIWLEKSSDDPDLFAELQALKDLNDEEGIYDRFYRELEFGTGGLRGVIGAGTNRMNIYTVRQATKGLADYVLEAGVPKRVAIGYDSRIKSRLFAENAAGVLAANGIEAFVYRQLMPTPALSFAVRELGCGAGICVTASHNPSKYNGYKAYGADGCQLTTAAAEAVLDKIKPVDPFAVPFIAFEEGLAAGSIKYIDKSVEDKFLDAVWSQRLEDKRNSELRVVYTPLNGAGYACVTKTLERTGIKELYIVEEQKDPDGAFPTCPFPNPEIREAMRLGLKLLEEKNADILIATDPDCDRCGTAVKNSKGEYVLINGNEMGVMLLDYICRMRKQNGTMPKNPVMIKTIVSTEMAAKVAAAYGVETMDVLTGFKYIGEIIGGLEAKGEENRYIFGFEESYGYLSGSYVRDKDAVNASLLISDMADWYRKKGMTLADAIEALYKRYGYFVTGQDSFEFEGASGFKNMIRLMNALRENAPEAFAGKAVVGKRDYLWKNGKASYREDLPSSDVLQFTLEDETLITVRPSGTEPKLKVYYSVIRPEREDALKVLAELRRETKSIIK